MDNRVSEANCIGFPFWSLTFEKIEYKNEYDPLMNRNVKFVTAKEVMKTIA